MSLSIASIIEVLGQPMAAAMLKVNGRAARIRNPNQLVATPLLRSYSWFRRISILICDEEVFHCTTLYISLCFFLPYPFNIRSVRRSPSSSLILLECRDSCTRDDANYVYQTHGSFRTERCGTEICSSIVLKSICQFKCRPGVTSNFLVRRPGEFNRQKRFQHTFRVRWARVHTVQSGVSLGDVDRLCNRDK